MLHKTIRLTVVRRKRNSCQTNKFMNKNSLFLFVLLLVLSVTL